MKDIIYTFRTKNFAVQLSALPENDLDLSWDEDGSTAEGLESGELCAFCAEVLVLFHGIELGADYLGGCIYKRPEDFRDHLGVRQYGRELSEKHGREIAVGSYFPSMVRQAIREARENMEKIKEAA